MDNFIHWITWVWQYQNKCPIYFSSPLHSSGYRSKWNLYFGCKQKTSDCLYYFFKVNAYFNHFNQMYSHLRPFSTTDKWCSWYFLSCALPWRRFSMCFCLFADGLVHWLALRHTCPVNGRWPELAFIQAAQPKSDVHGGDVTAVDSGQMMTTRAVNIWKTSHVCSISSTR